MTLTDAQETFMRTLDDEGPLSIDNSYECSPSEYKVACALAKKGFLVMEDAGPRDEYFEIKLTQAGLDYFAQAKQKVLRHKSRY